MRNRFRLFAVMLISLCLLTGCTNSLSETPPTISQPTETVPEDTTESQPVKMDIEDLIWKIQNATATAYAPSYTQHMRMDMRVGTPGFSMRIAFSRTSNVMLSHYPVGVYIDTDSVIILADNEITDGTISYIRAEEGIPVSYTYSKTGEFWYKYQIGETPSSVVRNYSVGGYPNYADKDQISLAAETEIVDGKEAYVLCFTQDARDLLYLLEDALNAIYGDIQVDVENVDAISMTTYYYIDAETFVPIGQKVNAEEMDEILKQILGQIQVEGGSSDVEVQIEVTELYAETWDLCYDPVTIPEVPEEAIEECEKDIAQQIQEQGTSI